MFPSPTEHNFFPFLIMGCSDPSGQTWDNTAPMPYEEASVAKIIGKLGLYGINMGASISLCFASVAASLHAVVHFQKTFSNNALRGVAIIIHET